MSDPAAEITEDLFLDGQLRLLQPKLGHRAGHDAILLAASTPARPGDRVIDFGAGVGAAGLSVARRVQGIDLTLMEIDPAVAELASRNAQLNGFDARVLVLDVGAAAHIFASTGLMPDSADVVLMNPPFNDASRHRESPVAGRRVAHVASPELLNVWIAAARRVLKSNGVLTLIWRADGLGDVLAALAVGFGGVEIQTVHSQADAPAIRLLVRASKNGKAPTVLHPALILNPATGNPAAEAVLRGQALLPLARR